MNKIDELVSKLSQEFKSRRCGHDTRDDIEEIRQIITDHIGPDLEERDKLRKFFELTIADRCWDALTEDDLDGGTLQNTAERMGLLVEVPADEEYREEWCADKEFKEEGGEPTMLIWSWSDRAKKEAADE